MRHLSPEPVAHLSQHRLLPLLRDLAAQWPQCRVRHGAAVRSVSERDGRVTLAVDSRQGSYEVAAEYVIACAHWLRGSGVQGLGSGAQGVSADLSTDMQATARAAPCGSSWAWRWPARATCSTW